MSSIWLESAEGQWEELSPSGFKLEEQLQEMVFRSIGMLPLAGTPVVVALATEMEVPITRGRVDIVGVETDGDLVIVEVKLQNNAEARKAIVAQVLSYAASLKGIRLDDLTQRLKAAGLQGESISAAVLEQAPVDDDAFNDALSNSLREGRFRLVLVLDEAPAELVRLVGYLESLSDGRLTIDLVTVSTFEVDSRVVAVPQRIDPQNPEAEAAEQTRPASAQTPVEESRGADLFDAAIDDVPVENRESLTAMSAWAKKLLEDGLVTLVSRKGSANTVLNLRVKNDSTSLAALWNDRGRPYLSLHETVWDRCAPTTLGALRDHLGGEVRPSKLAWADVTDELKSLVEDGYRETVGRPN